MSVDIDFDNNSIRSGTLDISGVSNFGQPSETEEVGWNITFSGQLTDTGFHSTSLNGDITGPAGSDHPCTSCVEGEVKAVIVKPGDKAVGGFQVRGTGGIQINAAGLYVLDKQP